MSRNVSSILGIGCGVLLALACSGRDSTSPREQDAFAGAGGEVEGQGGTPETAGGAGVSWGGGSGAGDAGAPVFSGGAAGEGGSGGSGNGSGAGDTSGEAGANAGGEFGAESTAGAAGAPSSWVTLEQRELCERLCAKEPLTNGFAGAPTVPCFDNETCVERLCVLIPELFTKRTALCADAFTAVLTCWETIPDDELECGSEGLVVPAGCPMEQAGMVASCY